MNLAIIYDGKADRVRDIGIVSETVDDADDHIFIFSSMEQLENGLCGTPIDRVIIRAGWTWDEIPTNFKLCCTRTCSISYEVN